MEQTGNLKNLTERLKEKAELERIETEKVFTEQLQILSSSLQESSTNALRTMSDAMAQEIISAAEKLNRHYRLLSFAFSKKWVSTAFLGIAIYLGMMLAGWGVMKFQERELQRSRNELERLEQNCQAQRGEMEIMLRAMDVYSKTLETLVDKTSGVAVMEWEGSRYVTAPVGSKNGITLHGRPAIKLKE